MRPGRNERTLKRRIFGWLLLITLFLTVCGLHLCSGEECPVCAATEGVRGEVCLLRAGEVSVWETSPALSVSFPGAGNDPEPAQTPVSRKDCMED